MAITKLPLLKKPTRVKHLLDRSGYYEIPFGGGDTLSKKKYRTTIPWGSETFERVYWSENEKKALARCIIELSEELNIDRKRVFQRVNKEGRYKVELL